MIQRVQSVWLFLAALVLTCMLFLPLLTTSVDGSEFSLYSNGLYKQKLNAGKSILTKTGDFMPLAVTNVAAITVSLLTIFLFRNRTLQKRLILASILLIVALYVLVYINLQYIPGDTAQFKFGLGIFLPPLAIIFCALAFRGIRKDEQLLRSADRLR